MTVAELRLLLSWLPGDLPVVLSAEVDQSWSVVVVQRHRDRVEIKGAEDPSASVPMAEQLRRVMLFRLRPEARKLMA